MSNCMEQPGVTEILQYVRQQRKLRNITPGYGQSSHGPSQEGHDGGWKEWEFLLHQLVRHAEFEGPWHELNGAPELVQGVLAVIRREQQPPTGR